MAEVFYFAGVTDEGVGSMMRAAVGQNHTIIATTTKASSLARRTFRRAAVPASASPQT